MDFLKNDNFPNEKTIARTESLIMRDLKVFINDNLDSFPPLRLEFINDQVEIGNVRGDGILHARWKDKSAVYGFICKASTSPKVFRSTIDALEMHKGAVGILPLIIVPYLSNEHLKELDEKEVSGMDLCGNGLLLSPEFRALRTGSPNRYKDTRSIRNPFGGDSSAFARCFLLKPEFGSLTALQHFAVTREPSSVYQTPIGTFALGTASKVVKTLEDELIVRKNDSGIVLQDPRRLLSLLRLGFRHSTRASVTGKTSLTNDEVWASLARAREDLKLRSIATGLSSSGRYKALFGIEKLSLYVDNLQAASNLLELRPGKSFANIELIEDRKSLVYFDARKEGDIRWASPIQTWLELATGGPREQEAASTLETFLADGHGGDLL